MGSSRYPITYDIPENKAFVDAFRAEYKNELPDWTDGEMYQALMILFAAIEKAGSPEPMKIVAAMEDLEVTSVKGPVKMRKCDHQGENQGFVVKVAKHRQVPRAGGRDRQDLSAGADHAGLPQRQLQGVTLRRLARDGPPPGGPSFDLSVMRSTLVRHPALDCGGA